MWPYYGYSSTCCGGYGSYAGYGSYYDAAAPMYASVTNPTAALDTAGTAPDPLLNQDPRTSAEFAGQGEAAFKAGDYKAAVYNWRHAVVDDPKNGVLVLMLSQALFATGEFDDAAGAAQHGMMLLPKESWSAVVGNYKELYKNIGDYTTQLRALEKASNDKPDHPGFHFLLGYHYGFLGYPADAVKQLDKTLAAAPRDEIAKSLRELMAAKLPKPTGAATEEKPDQGKEPNQPTLVPVPEKPL